MKTTLDIPEDLLEKLRHRAQTQQRAVDDVVTEILEANVQAVDTPPIIPEPGSLVKLPLFPCENAKGGRGSISPENLEEILEEEDLQRFYDSTR